MSTREEDLLQDLRTVLERPAGKQYQRALEVAAKKQGDLPTEYTEDETLENMLAATDQEVEREAKGIRQFLEAYDDLLRARAVHGALKRVGRDRNNSRDVKEADQAISVYEAKVQGLLDAARPALKRIKSLQGLRQQLVWESEREGRDR